MDEQLKIYLDAKFDAVDAKFDAVDKKFEAVDRRFEAIDKRFEAIDKRFDVIDKKFEGVDRRFEAIDHRLDAGEAKFEEYREANNRDLKTRLDDVFTHWSRFILDEMSSRFNEVNNRLESMDSRLKLQAGLIQSGARAMIRFSEYAENSEQRWVALVGRVEELERKLGTKH